jgi:hypothetical protein
MCYDILVIYNFRFGEVGCNSLASPSPLKPGYRTHIIFLCGYQGIRICVSLVLFHFIQYPRAERARGCFYLVDLTRIVNGRALRCGYTTGSCAAAAAKAAAVTLLSGAPVPRVPLVTPKGVALTLDIAEIT